MTPAPQPHPQRCTAEDIESISQFLDKYKDGELFFYSKKTIRRMVIGDDEWRKPYDIFLSRDNGYIIGIAIVSSKSKTLSLLFVAPEYRNHGIGKELYAMANPKQILAKRKAIPYFARLEGCATHTSHPSPEHELKDGECEFGQSYDKCGEYKQCEDCLKKEPSWLSKHDAAIAAQAREQVLPFLEELASPSVSDARKREILESLRAQQEQP